MSRRRRGRERPVLPARLIALFVGAAIGAAWGLIMWLLFSLGDSDQGTQLAYIVITTAMIGGGVAAIFGSVGARRRGERLFPRLPYRRHRKR